MKRGDHTRGLRRDVRDGLSRMTVLPHLATLAPSLPWSWNPWLLNIQKHFLCDVAQKTRKLSDSEQELPCDKIEHVHS